jgi:hypothetical protein
VKVLDGGIVNTADMSYNIAAASHEAFAFPSWTQAAE